jgi:hypothetical protein
MEEKSVEKWNDMKNMEERQVELWNDMENMEEMQVESYFNIILAYTEL